MKLLFSLFFPVVVWSKVLEVKNAQKFYRLEFDKKKISLTSFGMNLSLQSKPCNQINHSLFVASLEDSLIQMTKVSNEIHGYMKVNYDKMLFYENPSSKGGMFLNSLPEKVRALKVREKISCK